MTILMIENGYYEDHTVHGPFRVRRDIDQKAVLGAFRASRLAGRYHAGIYDFVQWLTDQGYIEQMPCVEWEVEDKDLTGKQEGKPEGAPW